MEKKPYGMQRNTPVSGVRKNRPIKNSLFLIAALLLISLTSLHADDVANLRCEYLENPLGIDVANSRLSWVIEERDQKPEAGSRKQTAYQVLVASTPELLAKDQGEQLQDFAMSTGRAAEAKRCGERLAALRPLVHKTFFQEAKGTYLYSSQSSLAMALYARIPPPELRSKIMAQLENMIVVEKQGHLDTGLLGTFVMLDLLIQENRNDLIDLIMGQTTYPGWGYLVKELGLKTWPETWSGWGSHVILVTATPGSWFYEGLAGIRPDPTNPGFRHFTLRPGIVSSVDWVRCSYQSPYGMIVSNWRRDGQKLVMDLTIPPNTTATVYVPAQGESDVTESGKPAAKSDGVKFLRLEKGAAVYEVGSGIYTFQSTSTRADP
jgi:alpha-L-rhamnosidase